LDALAQSAWPANDLRLIGLRLTTVWLAELRGHYEMAQKMYAEIEAG